VFSYQRPLKRLVVYLLNAFLFIILGVYPIYAQAVSFRVDQNKVRLIIPPAGSQTGIIKIYNQSNDILKVKVYLEDWKYAQANDGSKDFFPANTTPLSCAGWITFSPSEFSIPPYGIQNVSYTVRVPQEAKGGRYAVLFFETSYMKEKAFLIGDELKSGAFLNIRLGSLFYVEVKGSVKRDARIDSFSVAFNPDKKELSIRGELKNTGNADITTAATFHIMDQKGIVHARGEFNSIYILPGDKAPISASWSQPLLPGKYDLVLTLNLGKSLEETSSGRGPIITKEADLEIGSNTEVVSVGQLK